MVDRSGILPNSPLVYVLAGVRFATWSLLPRYIDEIHEGLRSDFPLLQKFQLSLAALNAQQESQTSTVWIFLSRDRSSGVQFSQDQVLLFERQYTSYAEFAEKAERTLTALLGKMNFLDAVNLGIRYVDHIKVRPGETVGQYVEAGLLPPAIEGLQTIGGIDVSTYLAGDSQLRVRCSTQPGSPDIPEDMLALASMAQTPGRTLEVKMLQSGEILFDVDSIRQYEVPVRMDNIETILNELDRLHSVANGFFRNPDVFTDHAFRTWKGDES